MTAMYEPSLTERFLAIVEDVEHRDIDSARAEFDRAVAGARALREALRFDHDRLHMLGDAVERDCMIVHPLVNLTEKERSEFAADPAESPPARALDAAVRPGKLDLDTLLYVRESIAGILHVGGIVEPLALIDSILSVRAEVLGLDADLDADLADAGSGISDDERWRRIEKRVVVVHVGDPDDRARAFNDGFDEAWVQAIAVLRDIRLRVPADQDAALAAIGEAISVFEKGALPMQSIEPQRLVIHDGSSYPVAIRVTPGARMGEGPETVPVMWSVDVEGLEGGISLTASGESLPVALERIEGVIYAHRDPMADLAAIATDHPPTDDELDVIEARLAADRRRLPHRRRGNR